MTGMRILSHSSAVTLPLATMPTTLSGSPSMTRSTGCSPVQPRPMSDAALEPEFQRALECVGIALQVRDDNTMAPGGLNADIDKRHRAPDQIGVREAQLLVNRRPARRLDEGRDIVVVDAEIDRRSQCRRPPMLIADFTAPGDDRRRQHRRVVERAVGREEGPAVRRVDCLTGQRTTKIGCDTDIVADLIAKSVPGRGAPGPIVLSPGEEIARQRAAIALILLVQEHAIVQRIVDRRQTGLDMAPGLLDPPPRDKGRHNIL